MSKKIIIKIFWWGYGIIFLFFLGIFFCSFLGLFGPLPNYSQLENPKTNLATQIISSDGEILGKYYFNDNRTPIVYNDLPKNIINPLIATEDERFYMHPGIDAWGTLRAIFYLGKKGGASTISQQLARQLFVGVRSRNFLEAFIQKTKEWIMAVQLERHYTKQEIIAMYLNIYDFGYTADGIQSAAKIYFNKKLKNLELHESATLIGMLQNSSLYNPIRRPELVLKRRNLVFSQMLRNKFVTSLEVDSLRIIPLQLNFKMQSHKDGLATYFRTYLKSFMKKWVKENPKPDGSYYNLYKDGLLIYTTINSQMQLIAENAMKKHMKNLQKEFFIQNNLRLNPTAPFSNVRQGQIDTLLQNNMKRSDRWKKMKHLGKSEKEIYHSFYTKTPMTVFSWEGEIDTLLTPYDSIIYYKHFLRSGLVSIEPQTGNIKAWVGGIDYKHFQYDHVVQGKRQTGSVFKPFLYATTIEQLKLSPCDRLLDALYCIAPLKYGNIDAWCPKNAGSKYVGMRTLKDALANSVNTISAKLMDKVGPIPVINLIKKMGITSYIPEVPAIALGTPDVNLLEMVGAYSTFANKGIYIKPKVITRIQNREGKILYQDTPQIKDVLSSETAYVTTKLLEGVTAHGSGVRLRHTGYEEKYGYTNVITDYPYEFSNPIAGKTGTTQNHSDGWFIGMVPNLATGIWVGGEDRSIHFKEITFGQGATMALPIWAIYMKAIYENPNLEISQEEFEAPKRLSISVNCSNNDNTFYQMKKDNLEKLGF